MMPLVLPYIIIGLIISSIFLLIFRKWLFSLILVITTISINIFAEYYTANISSDNKESGKIIVIATNNIHSQGVYLDKFRDEPDSLYEILINLNADILLLQEFDSTRCAKLTNLLAYDGYRLYQNKHALTYGENAIYSRYPVENVTFDNNGFFMYASLNLNGSKVFFVNCHFTSNNVSSILSKGDLLNKQNLLDCVRNVERSGDLRESEACHLRNKIDSCLNLNIPVILAGDINDVGGSKTIRKLEGNGSIALKDAWWSSGFGIGNTYHGYRWLNLRIDHIFYSKHFTPVESRVVSQPFSDHDILYAKIKLK